MTSTNLRSKSISQKQIFLTVPPQRSANHMPRAQPANEITGTQSSDQKQFDCLSEVVHFRLSWSARLSWVAEWRGFKNQRMPNLQPRFFTSRRCMTLVFFTTCGRSQCDEFHFYKVMSGFYRQPTCRAKFWLCCKFLLAISWSAWWAQSKWEDTCKTNNNAIAWKLFSNFRLACVRSSNLVNLITLA